MVTKASASSRAAPAGEAMAVVDARGLVAGWSEGARLLTGWAAADVTGRPASELVDGDASAARRALLAHGDALVTVRYRDGRLQELGLRMCPLWGVDGERRGFVVTAAPSAFERGLGALAFDQASMSMSVFDTSQRYLRMNDWACQVMGQPEAEFRHRYFLDTVDVAEHSVGFLRHLEIVVETGQPVRYESWTRSPSGRRMHAWTSEMWPVRDHTGMLIGTALAAFDSSEQFWARQRLALLNEAAGSIGTKLDVVQTARELAELVVPRLADFASVDLLESVLQGEEPETVPMDGGVQLRRAAHQSRTPGAPEAVVGLGTADVYPDFSPPVRALLTGEPVLTRTGDHDLDAWFARHGARSAKLREAEDHELSLMAVPLVARGTTLGVAILVRMLTPESPDAFDQDDVSLAEELSSRAAVCVDNARRYTRERTTALALQRSLLPKAMAGQAAVEFASRYLPALSQAGVGGDWFDVIPLSGTRVALVVGDVVGHGLHASVTMGRLRTAVWALADVDLPPDELLTHLDDLVEHLAAGDGSAGGEIGATCLYAVYDPVARTCAMASAGHPPPVVVRPDGSVEVVEVAAGPLLGVGGLPFEATELELPEGSVLALYTDGLVEARDRDVDTGTAALCAALQRSVGSLESACDSVLKELLPDTPADDVALLIARTRALDAEQVAVWNLTDDPALVANARKLATDQLVRWGLEEAVFVTELVVSELVTNAIRYGGAPIQLRLIRDRTLICEVSDASSTSPHLRRARTFDEGGRGLLLVAQLTDRWGSRPSGAGKTIWAEQALPPSL
ncbi:PAS domain-containing protein [Streptomyces ipomoeae]|uniref:PAS domain-containing protein n=2 Tax=Streptomyces ipomoeae TaxID=103232 RepID=A0A540QBA2_9ACTN|nr:SpoIIE family protein phosphatase [Streptomyces ipomoeae]MDX2695682.1 SpoIIE family protein phosphatase [Streptomyces ipomoeae]MDX2840981.1 SpoIIE family protein phosphatase [Streptomyces ipomoeae]MDX2933894.1 SpoIIE family protein phosphatase [Streptomyces ipomoeae]TQE28845.1 PAS domain-containing protein [Streptomyces ipomoeae]TQE32738.1 PAS domain-containing protein [Streptomyces ipomoeae]